MLRIALWAGVAVLLIRAVIRGETRSGCIAVVRTAAGVRAG
jgi:hypothetical protein